MACGLGEEGSRKCLQKLVYMSFADLFYRMIDKAFIVHAMRGKPEEATHAEQGRLQRRCDTLHRAGPAFYCGQRISACVNPA